MLKNKNKRDTPGVSDSRRRFLSAVAATGVGMMFGPRLDSAADAIGPRVEEIVAKTVGIDTHNHVDVPLTDAEMPGPDIDLSGEMRRSGLSAICMTFATDYQPGDALDRFLKGPAAMSPISPSKSKSNRSLVRSRSSLTPA